MDRNAQLSNSWILHTTRHSERVVVGNGNGNVYGLREKARDGRALSILTAVRRWFHAAVRAYIMEAVGLRRLTTVTVRVVITVAVLLAAGTPGVTAADQGVGAASRDAAARRDAVDEPVRGGLNAWREPRGDWQVAAAVSLDSQNDRRLIAASGKGVIINGTRGRTRNLLTRKEYGDVQAHIEFTVPRGSNSGVYFMGRYEIQVLDSWGVKKPGYSDCGGIYQRWDRRRGKGKEGFEGRPPRVNAARAPGQWQSFDVIFKAPRFDKDGKKVARARFVKVVHNGVVIHENQELSGPTRAASFRDEKPLGPLMLQGDHGPVAYRNIRIRRLENGDESKLESPPREASDETSSREN